jgi:hypothetical protein
LNLARAWLNRQRVRGSPTAPGKCDFPADCTRRTCTLPRVRSAVVLPAAGDPRRIRSLQPVQPAVLLLTAGHPHRTHSLQPVQSTVLFTCGGCSQFLYIPPYMYEACHAMHMSKFDNKKATYTRVQQYMYTQQPECTAVVLNFSGCCVHVLLYSSTYTVPFLLSNFDTCIAWHASYMYGGIYRN